MSRLNFFLVLFFLTSAGSASAQYSAPIAGSENALPETEPEMSGESDNSSPGEISFYDSSPLSTAETDIEAAAPPVNPNEDEELLKILNRPQKAPIVDPVAIELEKILSAPQKAPPAPIKPVEEPKTPMVLTSLNYGQEIETTDRDGNKVTGTIDSAWFDPVHGLMYFVKLPDDEIGVVDQKGNDAGNLIPSGDTEGTPLGTLSVDEDGHPIVCDRFVLTITFEPDIWTGELYPVFRFETHFRPLTEDEIKLLPTAPGLKEVL